MYSNYREKHIQNDLVGRGISTPLLLEAFRAVPRELFVLESNIEQAYDDRPLSIGYGQTISQPYIVALMSELLQLTQQDTVLEIGTGSGYQTAILSRLCAKVYTVEVVKELYLCAKKRLVELGYRNVSLKHGDGYEGWPENAPYYGIIVTCAPDHIPPPLLTQLAIGGRMVIPVGPERGIQELVLVEHEKNGYQQRSVIPVAFVPLLRGKQQLG
ncbi:MAG: protein-L-isoaspartate(D-aspartate) O-methyltransferase [Chloroflexi bacterium]|nr:protein-L-isoaspartate(D-aspartate) O-methyltransferase [Chloroflexota bacterium]